MQKCVHIDMVTPRLHSWNSFNMHTVYYVWGYCMSVDCVHSTICECIGLSLWAAIQRRILNIANINLLATLCTSLQVYNLLIQKMKKINCSKIISESVTYMLNMGKSCNKSPGKFRPCTVLLEDFLTCVWQTPQGSHIFPYWHCQACKQTC